MSNVVGFTSIGDTDKDGNMEIVHSQNGFSGTSQLVIFEHVADDSLVQAFIGPLNGNAASGEKVIADLDGDGRTEIAVSGDLGWVHIYESCGDSCWQLSWVDSTGMSSAYAVEGGFDSDHNGKPEFFVLGNVFAPTAFSWAALVYEADGDNQFQLVSTIQIPTAFIGETKSALADLDCDGTLEYIVWTFEGLWIYRSASVNNWELVSMIADPGGPVNAQSAIQTYDLNGNAIPELIWAGNPRTIVLEHNQTSDSRLANELMLRSYPNPARGTVTMILKHPSLASARLDVFDIRGRLVDRRSVEVRNKCFQYRVENLPSGIYGIQVHTPLNLITGRIVVNR
jgi:hypothetical protein